MTVLSFFPPGSRAAVPKLPMENISDVSVITCHSADEDTENAGGSLKAETSKWWHILRKMTSPWIWGSVVTATIVVALCTKRPEHGGPLSELQCSCRAPPAWLPEADHYYYDFQAYVVDVSQWTMLTDLITYQKRLAVIMCLGEQARKFARMISPQEIMTGIWHNGKLLDPDTHPRGVLQLSCEKVKGEKCQQIITQVSMPAGKPGGNTEALLAINEAGRQRSTKEGCSVTNREARGLQELRAAFIRLHQRMAQRCLFGSATASLEKAGPSSPCLRDAKTDHCRTTLPLPPSDLSNLRQLGTSVHQPNGPRTAPDLESPLTDAVQQGRAAPSSGRQLSEPGLATTKHLTPSGSACRRNARESAKLTDLLLIGVLGRRKSEGATVGISTDEVMNSLQSKKTMRRRRQM